jgi:TnpA family transposase
VAGGRVRAYDLIRMMMTEGRVFFGNLGQLRRGYERGMEDQLGALSLGLNAITWWNSLYIDAAVKQLETGGLG